MEALAILGIVVMFIGAIGSLIVAFRTSLLWGLGCLLLWPVSLWFLITHWDEAKNPFFVQLAGVAIVFVAGGFS